MESFVLRDVRLTDVGAYRRMRCDPAMMVELGEPVTNAPSNGSCRSLGFVLEGAREVDYNGTVLQCNDWVMDPQELASDLLDVGAQEPEPTGDHDRGDPNQADQD